MHGVSTRKVDDLVKSLGLDAGISKSEVSRICAQLDDDLEAFRTGPLDHVEFPYVFVDATYVKGRVRGRVVSRAVVVATGVTASGDREVLGVDVGDTEDGAFWTAFLRSLRARGLGGVQLVISDQHLGLKAAIAVGVHRRRLAALPGALHAQRAGQGPQSLRRDGRRGDPHDLRSTRRRPRPRPARRDRHHARPQFPDVAAMLDRRHRGPARVHRLPARALAQDLVDEPARAAQRRDQTTHQRRRHLPQRRRRPPARHRRRRRDPRRMGRRRTPLPLRRIHGQAPPARPHTRSRRRPSPSPPDTIDRPATTNRSSSPPSYTTSRDSNPWRQQSFDVATAWAASDDSCEAPRVA